MSAEISQIKLNISILSDKDFDVEELKNELIGILGSYIEKKDFYDKNTSLLITEIKNFRNFS